MAEERHLEHYLFVIDTNSYAGNFERDLCAFITGQVGECEVGFDLAEIARKEIPDAVKAFDELVASIPGEHGADTPVTIFSSPKHDNVDVNNSVAIYLSKIPDPKLLEIMKQRAAAYVARGKIKIEGFRLLEKSTVYKELKI